jgi:cob(I)alamin adenosyltransferase
VTTATRPEEAHIREILVVLQNELFDLGSELATPFGAGWEGMPKTEQSHVARLEGWIDELNDSLVELKSFVLPGGTPLNAQLHLARAVCRRGERAILALNDIEPLSEHVVRYVNRLSDLLFVMSRAAAQVVGCQEFLWVPGGSRPQPRIDKKS